MPASRAASAVSISSAASGGAGMRGRDICSIAIPRPANFVGLGKLRQPAFEGLLHGLGVGGGEAVLGGEGLASPGRGLIGRYDSGDLAQEPIAQGRGLAGRKDGCSGGARLRGASGMSSAPAGELSVTTID